MLHYVVDRVLVLDLTCGISFEITALASAENRGVYRLLDKTLNALQLVIDAAIGTYVLVKTRLAIDGNLRQFNPFVGGESTLSKRLRVCRLTIHHGLRDSVGLVHLLQN